MDTRLATQEIRIQQWAGIIRSRNGSGLTVDKFCELNNISRNQYYYWLRKLKEHTLERSGFTFVELDEPVEPEAAPIDAALSNDIVVSLGDACITVKEGVFRHLLEMVVGVIRNAE